MKNVNAKLILVAAICAQGIISANAGFFDKLSIDTLLDSPSEQTPQRVPDKFIRRSDGTVELWLDNDPIHIQRVKADSLQPGDFTIKPNKRASGELLMATPQWQTRYEAEKKAAEEERLAKQKAAEEERQAKQKAAEEARLAAEKAAEEERLAAERAKRTELEEKLAKLGLSKDFADFCNENRVEPEDIVTLCKNNEIEVDTIGLEHISVHEDYKHRPVLTKSGYELVKNVPKRFIEGTGTVCLWLDDSPSSRQYIKADSLQSGEFTITRDGRWGEQLKATPQWHARQEAEKKAAEEARLAAEKVKRAEMEENLAKLGLSKDFADFCNENRVEPQDIVTLCKKNGIEVEFIKPEHVLKDRYERMPRLTASGNELARARQEEARRVALEKNLEFLKNSMAESELIQKIESAYAGLAETVNTYQLLAADFSADDKDNQDQLQRGYSIFINSVTNVYIRDNIGPIFLLSNDGKEIVFNKSAVEEGLTAQCKSLSVDITNGMRKESVLERFLCVDNPSEKLSQSVNSWRDVVVAMNEKKAREKALINKYETMSNEEKFPLLKVHSKPQMLMKDVFSGSSIEWVEGWLLANKITITHKEGPDKEGWARITGEFLKDGKVVRKVRFVFWENALYGVNIELVGTSITTDEMSAKYLKEMGKGAKTKTQTGKVRIASNGDQSITWVRDDIISVETDDMIASADYMTFAGLSMFSESTLVEIQFMGAEEKMRYVTFSKDSKADLVINADGSTLRCTKNGEMLRPIIKKQLPEFSKAINNKIRIITLRDKKLMKIMKETEEKAKEAKAKADEAAKKAKAAEALDF